EGRPARRAGPETLPTRRQGTAALHLDALRAPLYACGMRSSLGVPEWLLGASARILLLALSVATLGPALHGVHDVDCEPGFVLHDESQHHVQATDTGRASALPADHCVACHF